MMAAEQRYVPNPEDAIARERGIRLARTPATALLGCRGCTDPSNLLDPTGGAPRRCRSCPVGPLATRLRKSRC